MAEPSRRFEDSCKCGWRCANCGRTPYQMSNCVAWNPCPTQWFIPDDCPEHGRVAEEAKA